MVSSAIFEAMNCPVVHVRLLGYFKAEVSLHETFAHVRA